MAFSRSTYPAHGFTFDLPSDTSPTDARARMVELQANNWIDNQTRYVSVEFAPFQVNLEVWGFAIFIIEFTQGGSIEPSPPSLTVGHIPGNLSATIISKLFP